MIQLCATATIVGASAVGLSFGREAPLDPHANNKRKSTLARELTYRPISTPLHIQPAPAPAVAPPTSTTAAQFPSGPPPLAAPFRAPVTARPSRDALPQRRIVKTRRSLDQPVPPQSASAANRSLGLGDSEMGDLLEPSAARRPSWMKRLSAISTSLPSSRDTSPAPMSPSVSVSNGSMAFSHDGSTAPMIGDRPPPPMPPNKLVKRSSSVHITQAATSQGTGSRLPSFRRPATSHQRSATIQHQTALLDMTLENPSVHTPPRRISDTEMEYTQYFTAKIIPERSLSKKKNPVAYVKGLKRIFPDDASKPTLLLAKSVSANHNPGNDDESTSEDGDSVGSSSRPDSPLPAHAALNQSGTPMPNDGQHNKLPADAFQQVNTTRPRRSFSINNLLPRRSSFRKQRQAVVSSGVGLARTDSQKRVISAPPMSTIPKRQSSTAHGESAAIPLRRDPTLVRRQISTSAGPLPQPRNARHGSLSGSSPWPLPALPALSPPASGRVDRAQASMRTGDVIPSASATTNHTPPSPILAHTAGRPSRNSMAPSEQASTLVGSDNEARGMGTGDEDDADVQSETAFDSLRTGATRSTTGARGPRIETIFDESPPSKPKVTALRDLLPKGTFREQTADAAPGHQSIAEEDESISTPVRTVVPDRSLRDSPSYQRGHSTPLFPSIISSSPPDMPKPLSLGTLEWDSRAGDDDSSSRWSLDEDEDDASWGELPTNPSAVRVPTPATPRRLNLRLLASGPSPTLTTPPSQNLALDHVDKDARSSIFDWSEQHHTDKSSGNCTPPRPSTVHGKKDADRRGSRSVGRRVPSGLHARSQSVPVVPDATGKRNTVVTNKFGTWGVGSKGVTEDWNDDFDFSDLHEEPSAEGSTQSRRVDSGTAMLVPKTIQEQQSNVLANIGLLREWGLLIEELKEQKVRAASLGILHGSHSGTWEEVDAMIDLADQEVEHEGIPRLTPPSSPFDEGVFDDVSGPSPNETRTTLKLGSTSEDVSRSRSGVHRRTSRRSILRSHHQIFGPQSSPIPPKSNYESPVTPTPTKLIVNRPRKDSEAKARSVIEALQQKRKSTPDALADTQTADEMKKVPFDTATLRRIVPYVNSLTRKVKDTLREAEGLYSSPNTSPSKENEPPFNKMFQSEKDLTTEMKLMTVM